LVSLRFDSKANALYMKIAEGRVSETEPLNDGVFIDLDEGGKILGIEIILPKNLSKKMVEKIAQAVA